MEAHRWIFHWRRPGNACHNKRFLRSNQPVFLEFFFLNGDIVVFFERETKEQYGLIIVCLCFFLREKQTNISQTSSWWFVQNYVTF